MNETNFALTTKYNIDLLKGPRQHASTKINLH